MESLTPEEIYNQQELLNLENRVKTAEEHVLQHEFTNQYTGKWIANTKYYWNVDLKPLIEAGINREEALSSDTAILEELEALYPAFDAAKAEAEMKAEIRVAAQSLIKRCDDALLYIVEYNTQKYAEGILDSDGLDALEITFSEVMSALINKRPEKAAMIIASLDLTGTIYTETQRTEIVNILRNL